MTDQSRLFCPHKMIPLPGTSLFAAVALVAGSLTLVSPAFAQSDAITVDLSVLQDRGGSGMGARSQTGLMIPPRSNPVSELHVSPQNMLELKASRNKANGTLLAPKEHQIAVAKVPKPEIKAEAAPVAPAPQPAPLEKVVKVTPSPAPDSKPEPLEKVTKVAPEPVPAPVKANIAPPLPPTVAAAPEPTTPTEQAKTDPTTIELGQAMQIEFEAAETKLPDSLKNSLRKIADGIHDKKDLRLQLMAYAGAEGLSASKARRLSLSRALSVRSFLIESGVRSTRIDVRALGNKTTETPLNRVDVNIAKR